MVYLPLASQHLDVKTIGRGGLLRRLLKPDKGRPFLRACQRLPVEVAPQVGMSVRGAAVFLRVGYVAGHLYGLHPATNAIGRCLSWVICDRGEAATSPAMSA